MQQFVLTRLIQRYIESVNFYNLKKDNQKKLNFNDFYFESVLNLREDVEFKHLDKDHFDKESFILIMKQYLKADVRNNLVQGRYHYLFDEDEELIRQINSNPMVVFELELIKENIVLFAITYFLITRIVSNKLIRKKHQRNKLIFALDECWMLLRSNSESQRFLEYCFRTFRKHDGSIMISTQDINDIFKNEQVGAQIFGSCSMLFMKKQKTANREVLRKYLNFSDYQLAQLYSIENPYEEIFIKIEEQTKVLKIELDRYKLMLYDTRNEIKKRVKKELIKTDGNIVCAIKNIIYEQDTSIE